MVIAAAPEVVIGRDIEVRYLPDPDLFYLTGYAEPEAVVVLCPSADAPFSVFVRDRDPRAELWTGPREEPGAIGERLGADAVASVAELPERLPRMLTGVDRIYYRVGSGRSDVEGLVLDILGGGRSARQRSGRGPAELADPGLILDGMRLIKDDDEIAAIRAAVDVTTAAFREALSAVRPGAGEWEIEAAVEGAFRRVGAHGPAFATIAASGPNATVLHYTANNRTMEAGDLLLLDAGARHHGYNGDITRTVPVGRPLEGAARDVYDVVLAAEHAAIAAVRPGATTRELHDAALDILRPAMVELRLAEGPADSLREREDAWKPFFPHSTSHWLGLDVHDVGTYSVRDQPRRLQPGMVLTIEPGLYIPSDDPDAPEHLRGIGVRIEDDILVTASGHENLSASLPTDPDAVADLAG